MNRSLSIMQTVCATLLCRLWDERVCCVHESKELN